MCSKEIKQFTCVAIFGIVITSSIIAVTFHAKSKSENSVGQKENPINEDVKEQNDNSNINLENLHYTLLSPSITLVNKS